MTEGRWKRIEDVFLGALAVDEHERDRFVTQACGDDTELRADVAAMLASSRDAEQHVGEIVASGVGAFANHTSAPLIGRAIGPYQLVALLGEGGMGAVYLAERSDAEFRRHVAIKVLREGLASRDMAARFRDERQILADLDHPSIVRLIDGGTTDGMPYLVMERVDGLPITQHADARGLSVHERITLVRGVCAALAYSHARNVVHRDIKPSNILVTPDGTSKLVDFGIAKLLDGEAQEARTKTGAALLTPEYASPEQASGAPITPATDIYSLGAVIYELLTERPPLQLHGGPLAIVKTICEIDPPLPSTIAPAITRDLDNIVMKALHKNPAQRYATVEALDQDLARFLDGRAVKAGPPSWLGFARRRSQRKLAIGLALAAGTLVAFATLLRPSEHVAKGSKAMQRLTSQLGTVGAARFATDGRIIYSAKWGDAPRTIYSMRPGQAAREVLTDAELLAVSPAGDIAVLLDVKVAGIATGITRTGTLATATSRTALATDVISADWSRDLAITRFIRGYSTNGGGSRGTVEWPIGTIIYENNGIHLASIRISPDGNRVAFVEGDVEKQIVVVDRDKHVTKLGGMHDISGLAWHGDELWVADATDQSDRCVHAVKLDGTRSLVQCGTGTLTLFDVDSAGRVLVSSARTDARILLKTPGGTAEREVQWHTNDVLYDVTPDGKRIVFGPGTLDGPLYIRDHDREPVRIGNGLGVAISPDGAWVATTHEDRRHYLTPTGAGREVERSAVGAKVAAKLGGWYGTRLYNACFLDDGTPATCTFTTDGHGAVMIRGKRPGASMNMRSISPDGKWILGTDGKRTLELIATDGSTSHELLDTPATRNLGHSGFGTAVGWSADSRSVFVIGGDKRSGRLDPRATLDVEQLDLTTGLATAWKTLGPEERSGNINFTGVVVFAGGEGYAYSYERRISDLYLMTD